MPGCFGIGVLYAEPDVCDHGGGLGVFRPFSSIVCLFVCYPASWLTHTWARTDLGVDTGVHRCGYVAIIPSYSFLGGVRSIWDVACDLC